ncbi:hypothetical protein KPH14_012920, partial [Odynerus spinipes]
METWSNLPCNSYLYEIAFTKCVLDVYSGKDIQQSLNPNMELQRVLQERYPGYIPIYTDGSKIDGEKATGVACICPALNITETLSLPMEVSIFTAECHAISCAMDLISSHKDLSFVVCTDSLSTVQAISKVTLDTKDSK